MFLAHLSHRIGDSRIAINPWPAQWEVYVQNCEGDNGQTSLTICPLCPEMVDVEQQD